MAPSTPPNEGKYDASRDANKQPTVNTPSAATQSERQPAERPPAVAVRLKCDAVNKIGTVENVELSAVYSNDPKHPNHKWSLATPSGSLNLSISNPEAHGQFKEGDEYLVEVRPA